MAGINPASSGARQSGGAVVEYLADGLAAGTTYYWKVEALDGQGGISESEVRSFTTQ